MEFILSNVQIEHQHSSHPAHPFLVLFDVEYQGKEKCVEALLSKNFERCSGLSNSYDGLPFYHDYGLNFEHLGASQNRQLWLEVEEQIDTYLKQKRTEIKNRLFQRVGIYSEDQGGSFELYYEASNHRFYVGKAHNLWGLNSYLLESFFEALREKNRDKLSLEIDRYDFENAEGGLDFELHFDGIDEIALSYLGYTMNDIRS